MSTSSVIYKCPSCKAGGIERQIKKDGKKLTNVYVDCDACGHKYDMYTDYDKMVRLTWLELIDYNMMQKMKKFKPV